MEAIQAIGESKETPPFYEHRAFKGTAAVVALVTALVALMGPLRDLVDNLAPDQPQRGAWTQVVLNTSGAMSGRFGDREQTKLEAAADAIGKTVKELDSSGVGLRATATSCDGESRKVIGLARGDSDDVINAAAQERPRGEASIVDAVAGGLDEFNREPMRRTGPRSWKMFVFSTAMRPCPLDHLSDAVQHLEQATRKRHGSVTMFVLGPRDDGGFASIGGGRTELASLRPTAEGDAELDALSAALGSTPTIHYVDSPEELYQRAETAGEEAREESEEGETGTSDEGEPQ